MSVLDYSQRYTEGLLLARGYAQTVFPPHAINTKCQYAPYKQTWRLLTQSRPAHSGGK